MSVEQRNETNLQTRRLSDEDVLRRGREGPGQSARSPMLLVIYDRDGIRAVPLAAGRPLVVGRARPAGVVLRDASLSRQHARFELVDGAVWLEDLGSTNGTRVDGRRIDRLHITADSTIQLGGVPAALHAFDPALPTGTALESHDRFCLALEREVARARCFGRSLVLVLLRCRAGGETPVSGWFPGIQAAARPFEQLALYGPDTIECLLPEMDGQQAAARIEPLLAEVAGLRAGLAGLPESAGSAETLLELAREALGAARDDRPLVATPAAADVQEAATTDTSQVVAGPVMRRVLATAERVATSSIPVLLVGETGAGKEVVARTIHDSGPRSDRPLLCVNCGGIPEQLVESTLFGHEAGAFTGATQRRQGVFEAADGGSVLLDEVGELPPAAQAALLRVLENRRFCRVGGTREVAVDVRTLAATHRDLDDLCREGAFREDLLYRLNAMTLEIPPLRERTGEIAPLAQRFAAEAAREDGRAPLAIAPAALELLRAHRWPGNVRELRNAMARAVVIADGDRIEPADLPDRVRGPEPGGPKAPAGPPAADRALKQQVAAFEAELILEALVACDWDRNRTADRLGLPLRTLAYKIQAHQLGRGQRPDRDT